MTTFDEETLARRAVLKKLEGMSSKELFGIAVRAGIYTKQGKLTAPYRATKASRRKPVSRAKKA